MRRSKIFFRQRKQSLKDADLEAQDESPEHDDKLLKEPCLLSQPETPFQTGFLNLWDNLKAGNQLKSQNLQSFSKLVS